MYIYIYIYIYVCVCVCVCVCVLCHVSLNTIFSIFCFKFLSLYLCLFTTLRLVSFFIFFISIFNSNPSSFFLQFFFLTPVYYFFPLQFYGTSVLSLFQFLPRTIFSFISFINVTHIKNILAPYHFIIFHFYSFPYLNTVTFRLYGCFFFCFVFCLFCFFVFFFFSNMQSFSVCRFITVFYSIYLCCVGIFCRCLAFSSVILFRRSDFLSRHLFTLVSFRN